MTDILFGINEQNVIVRYDGCTSIVLVGGGKCYLYSELVLFLHAHEITLRRFQVDRLHFFALSYELGGVLNDLVVGRSGRLALPVRHRQSFWLNTSHFSLSRRSHSFLFSSHR